MHRAYITLGSNIDAQRNLPAALALLRPFGVAAVSEVYETTPVGTRDGRPFLNAAVLLLTALSAEEVKTRVCRANEERLGRRRDPRDRFAPRTIDLDLVLWDRDVREVLGSPVPDPDVVRYLHVARPLADLDPDYVHPQDGRTLAAIAADLAAGVKSDARPRSLGDVAGWVTEL